MAANSNGTAPRPFVHVMKAKGRSKGGQGVYQNLNDSPGAYYLPESGFVNGEPPAFIHIEVTVASPDEAREALSQMLGLTPAS